MRTPIQRTEDPPEGSEELRQCDRGATSTQLEVCPTRRPFFVRAGRAGGGNSAPHGAQVVSGPSTRSGHQHHRVWYQQRYGGLDTCSDTGGSLRGRDDHDR